MAHQAVGSVFAYLWLWCGFVCFPNAQMPFHLSRAPIHRHMASGAGGAAAIVGIRGWKYDNWNVPILEESGPPHKGHPSWSIPCSSFFQFQMHLIWLLIHVLDRAVSPLLF